MKKYLLILFAFFFLLACQVKNHKQKTLPPNVIVILTDDQGYKDVGFNGCLDIPTPNIDRIAENGVVFTNGYVSYCVCGPSRAGLITGRYQDRFGFGRNPLFAPNDSLQGLPLSEETLAYNAPHTPLQASAKISQPFCPYYQQKTKNLRGHG